MSAVIARLLARHPDKIRSAEKDRDGLWIYLKPGWQTEPFSECHTVHEWNTKDLLAAWKNVCRCECSQCAKTHILGIAFAHM